MRKGRRRFALAVALLAAWPAAAGFAADMAGDVTRVQSDARALSAGAERRLKAADPVFVADQLRTGAGSRLEVRLADGTSLTLGERAEVTVDSLVFDPRAQTSDARLKVLAGAFRVVTAELGARESRRLAVSTPFATLGIRGTEFWGGPLDAAFEVFLVRGVVAVETPAGSVVLDQPGQGTTIAAPGAPPAPPSFWSEEKRSRAFATVGFQ
ncbi:MAG: FecR domain-containing protein [Proteobacteria bacterium]|nr:FecR domain-containing protein [Pseudomonadota bacterium]